MVVTSTTGWIGTLGRRSWFSLDYLNPPRVAAYALPSEAAIAAGFALILRGDARLLAIWHARACLQATLSSFLRSASAVMSG
jgi:hypothetical protein